LRISPSGKFWNAGPPALIIHALTLCIMYALPSPRHRLRTAPLPTTLHSLPRHHGLWFLPPFICGVRIPCLYLHFAAPGHHHIVTTRRLPFHCAHCAALTFVRHLKEVLSQLSPWRDWLVRTFAARVSVLLLLSTRRFYLGGRSAATFLGCASCLPSGRYANHRGRTEPPGLLKHPLFSYAHTTHTHARGGSRLCNKTV